MFRLFDVRSLTLCLFIMHHYSIQSVAFRNIDSSSDWSLHPFLPFCPSSQLKYSIGKIGLLHLPIVLQINDNTYQLLCGSLRMATFEQQFPSTTDISCLVFNKNTPTATLLLVILEEHLLSGKLTSIEKAYFYKICLRHIGINEIAKLFSPVLGEKIQNHSVNKSLQLLTLEQELQVSLYNAIIGEKIAYELLTLNPEDRMALHSLFSELGLGGGKQNRLLHLSRDLAYREEKTITKLLQEEPYKAILSHSEMNHPQKIANVLTILQKNLFPHSTSAEDDFNRKVNSLNLPSVCSIQHSQAFENDKVTMTLHFHDLHELEEKIPSIVSAINNLVIDR